MQIAAEPSFSWVLYTLGFLIVVGLVIDIALMIRFCIKPLRQPAPDARLKTRPWGWLHTGFVALVLITLHLLLLLAYRLAASFGLPTEMLSGPAIAAHTLTFHAAAILIIAALLHRTRMTWDEAFGIHSESHRHQFAYAACFLLAIMPVVALTGFIYSSFLTDIGIDVDSQAIVLQLMDPSAPLWFKIWMGIVAVTIVPVAEELLFRGIGMSLLSRHVSPLAAILLSSALFSVIHLHVPSYAPLFVVACAFGTAYLYSGSILVPITMHMLFNAFGIAAAFSTKAVG